MKTDAEIYFLSSGKRTPLEYSLDDYWLAPSGEGPLGYTWDDKPHRLLYDLIGEIAHLNAALEGKNAKQVLEKM